MKKYIIIWCLLLVSAVISCAAIEKDSIRKLPQEILSMKHDSLRLNKIIELTTQTVNEPEEYSFYLGELLREAEVQKNQREIAKTYLLHLYLSYNQRDEDKVNQWMSKLEPLARKEGYYDLLFDAQQCIIDILIIKQEYELVEQMSEKMLAEAQKINQIDAIVAAYKCLASVYRSTYRYEKSAEMLEKAFKLSPKMTNQQSKLEVMTYLIAIYRHTKDYPKWLKYLKIKENEIKDQIKKDPSLEDYYKGNLMLTYLSYLSYYIEVNQKEKAEYYKSMVEKYRCDEFPVYQYNYAKGLVTYYQFTKEWDKALGSMNELCEIIKPLSFRDYPYILSSKADMLYQMGLEKEASDTIKKVLQTKDALRVSIFNKQIEQIKANYNTNQELLEQARIQRYFRYSVLGIVIILIVILSYSAYKYNQIKKNLTQSDKKIRQVAEEVQKATRAKERFLSNMSYAIRTPLNEVVNRSLLLTSKQQISEEERAEVAQTILGTSADLMKLVEEILDLSRLESGRMKFNVSEVDVNALLRDAIGSFATSDAEFVSSFPESESLWTQIDGTRLMQVCSSLLSDTEKGKKIRVELKKEPGDLLSVRISHTTFASLQPTQDIIIRNEINRMIIEHFEGSYEIISGAVRFTLKTVHL